MEEEKKTIQFTIEHIRKYLDGELSAPDMHALEKAALEDPFLADAMEGFKVSRKQSGSFESDMSDLQNRLIERINQKKKRNRILILMKWPVAASILIIAGATIFTLVYITREANTVKISSRDKKDNLINRSLPLPKAKADTTGNASKNPAPVGNNTKSTTSGQSIINEQLSSGKKTTNHIQREISPNHKIRNPEPLATLIYHADYDSIPNPDPYKKYDRYDKAASSVAVLTPTQSLRGKVSGLAVTRHQAPSKPVSSEIYISGIVVNEKEEPIQNATVSLSHSENRVTTTDSNGLFKIYLNNSESVGRIVVNSVGYQTASAILKADSSSHKRIQLQPTSMALNEVVVTGYGTEEKSEINGLGSKDFSKRKSLAPHFADSLASKYAAPVVGWEAYGEYLAENKKILTADSFLVGTEIVTFHVNAGGELSNFNIVESVSPAHDAELIRLIKEGPGWKISKGKKQKCQVSLIFK